MNWSNVKLIWLREVRDQLRDRRTMFMIAVLPLLLYPLLGMSLLQVAQFLQEHPTKVLIVGWKPLPGLPPLVEEQAAPKKGETDDKGKPTVSGGAGPKENAVKFAPKLIGEETRKLMEVALAGLDDVKPSSDPAKAVAEIRQLMQERQIDVVVVFPPDFSQRLEQFRQDLIHRRGVSKTDSAASEVPSPAIYHNSVKEKSQVAFARVAQIVRAWQASIAKQTLRESDLPETVAQPFAIAPADVAEPTQRQAAVWSKILPFVLLIWALTGAFYPSIDLCAGEKERGTLETLLCSPAERSEIVAGKLLAVMMFSMATSLLNIASLGATGLLVARQFGNLGAAAGLPAGFPPISAILWLVAALVPASALFSALCLALAVFARSSKEGQYYLMPMILGTMPLMVLPMAPGVELTLGNSLIPLTGLILLLRMLLEGNVHEALPFIPPVALVTLICCRVAMKWAVDQFNREHVLFRESERWDMRLWLKHLRRDRTDTPNVGKAVTCGVLILVMEFVFDFMLPPPTGGFWEFVRIVVAGQFGAILLPAVAMTLFLTRRPAQTLLLRRPSAKVILAAIALAVAMQPLNQALQWVIQNLYPVGQGAAEVSKMVAPLYDPPVWWLPMLIIGLLPAVCEEFAFRGFILSGMRHSGSKWQAILVTSLFFAVSHQVLQQSLGTFVIGILIAYMAVQTGSIWPGLVFHALHNSLAWLYSLGQLDLTKLEKTQPTLAWIGARAKELSNFLDDRTVSGFLVLGAALVLAAIVAWFSRLSYTRTEEEELQEAIRHESAQTTRV